MRLPTIFVEYGINKQQSPFGAKICSDICPRTFFSEKRTVCALRGTDNVQGQIFQHIFAPNGDYCLYYPSNLFASRAIFSYIPQFQLGNIRSRDALRPIGRIRKDLMDYYGSYTMMAKPMKTLQFHYPMIQFLIINNYSMSARWI